MIDFWSYRLPESLRRWSAIQKVLRSWVRNPALSSKFLKMPELNSVSRKTDIYLMLLITHQKIWQIKKILEKVLARKPLKFV